MPAESPRYLGYCDEIDARSTRQTQPRSHYRTGQNAKLAEHSGLCFTFCVRTLNIFLTPLRDFCFLLFLSSGSFLKSQKTPMEVLRCFNCDHTGRRHEDFFNITRIHPSFAAKASNPESDETGQDESLKGKAFLVCGDCVYDRLQECQSCAKKAPLCMFKIAEWFCDKKNRNCIDCAATFEALGLFQTGYHSSVIIRQCSVCRHFKYLPSFISWSKHKPHDTLKDCFECQLRRDIVQYKRELRDRYEEKLQQEPVLGDDSQPPRTGGNETVAQQGATYASVVTKGFPDSKLKSSSATSENGQLRTNEVATQLNFPIESGLHTKGKCINTGLEGK